MDSCHDLRVQFKPLFEVKIIYYGTKPDFKGYVVAEDIASAQAILGHQGFYSEPDVVSIDVSDQGYAMVHRWLLKD